MTKFSDEGRDVTCLTCISTLVGLRVGIQLARPPRTRAYTCMYAHKSVVHNSLTSHRYAPFY